MATWLNLREQRALGVWLEAEEGFSAVPYRDSLGYWTIGIGCLISKDVSINEQMALLRAGGKPWTHEDAVQRMQDHILISGDELTRVWTRLNSSDTLEWATTTLPQYTRTALVAMCYQMGEGALGNFRQMFDALRVANRDWAAFCAVDSVWAQQTRVRAFRTARCLSGRDFRLPSGVMFSEVVGGV